jgi:hypothetical protein
VQALRHGDEDTRIDEPRQVVALRRPDLTFARRDAI